MSCENVITQEEEVILLKLTVKKAETVATSAVWGDGLEPSGPWKEAKAQCL